MPNPAAGFFGKLPSAGDFVQRRLPPGFVDVWDSHFENAVAASRSALDSGWHEAYHASPVWRFLLSAGACGESAWAGIMGPGTDRVGRCFPMVIAAPVATDAGSGTQVLLDGGSWFDAAEQVHSAAQVDAAISVDNFDEQVAALAAPLDAAQPRALEFLHGVDWSVASHWRLPLPIHDAATSFLSGLWTRLMATPGNWCLWWTAGAERVPPSVLITNGLPQPAAYAGFLDASRNVAPWQALGMFECTVPRQPEAPEVAAYPVSLATPAATPWLPDDIELLSDLGVAPDASVVAMPAAQVAAVVAADEPVAGVSVWHRPDGALTLVAAEVGKPDSRQHGVAAIAALGRDLDSTELAVGLCARIMALNPGLRQASEDLIDPVLEDCAVVAVHVIGAQADLLRVGTAVAWHWRRGRLQPCFANSHAALAADAGGGDYIDDLLFSRVSLTAPGLGATAQPVCDEVSCAVEAGDRLLLLATLPLAQISPEILVHGLALPSRDDASRHIATAAGLGADPARWPLAIIEIDA
ncbi:MAG: type VI secretion system-associated protein TagF [Rhodanobacter sp.]